MSACNAQRRSASALHWNSLATQLYWAYDGPVGQEALKTRSDHRHGFWVWLMRKGSVRVGKGRNVWQASKGQWLISPHGEIDQQFTSDARILSIHFRCQWPTGQDLFLQKNGLVFQASSYPNLERSGSRLQRLLHRHFPSVRVDFLRQSTPYPTFLRLQQRFLQWLIDFYEAMISQNQTLFCKGEGDERVWRTAELLQHASLDGPFPAAQIEMESSLCRDHLDVLFCKEFGVTTWDYWQNLRQESAVKNLEATTMSIKEIGYRLGFKQPSHFTQWFTRRVGASPQAYRTYFDKSPHNVKDLLARYPRIS